VIFTNQIREKVGVLFGSPETTPGGWALKFYASIRMNIRKVETIKQGQEIVGSRTRVKVVKNKLAPPFREAEFDILYGEGISREGNVLDVASELGIVSRTGTWYAFGDIRLGQGRENAREYLRQNPELTARIEAQVREAVGLLRRPSAEPEEPARANGGAGTRKAEALSKA